MSDKRIPSAREKAAARIKGKGWTTGIRRGMSCNRYVGYAVRDRRRVLDGSLSPRWDTREEAIKFAIAHAHKVGTLDWKKTVEWIKTSGINVSIDGLELPKPPNRSCGWYMDKLTCGKYYKVRVGATKQKSMYWAGAPSPCLALERAIDMGLMDEPHFDFDVSICYLKKRELYGCIDMLRERWRKHELERMRRPRRRLKS